MNKKYVLLAMTAVVATVPAAAFAQPYHGTQYTQTVKVVKYDNDRHHYDNDRHFDNDRRFNNHRRVVKVDISAPHRLNREGCGWGTKITRYSNGDRISQKAFVCKASHGRWNIR